MEIWGGNRAIEKSFEAPGLDIYVHSQPFQDCDAGGDIYYLTSCASGRISRFLLADVSGHGTAAAGMAGTLRDLMRQNVNRFSQKKFVEEMNREFGKLSHEGGFATSVVATFLEPMQSLDISVAGHPYPIYYHSDHDEWLHLEPKTTSANFENMPLGILCETTYPGRKVETKPGDMFLLYSDAFMESTWSSDSHSMLNVSGILKLLNENKGVSAGEVIPFLRDRIGSMATGNLINDDASLVVGHFTDTKVRMRDNLMAPIRLFGDVSDRTEI